MNDPLSLASASIAGALLGTMFYGGLWWTVRRGISSKRAAIWFLGSLLLRTGAAFAGFCLASDGRWERLLACLLGFVMSRFAVTRLAQSSERRHAP